MAWGILRIEKRKVKLFYRTKSHPRINVGEEIPAAPTKWWNSFWFERERGWLLSMVLPRKVQFFVKNHLSSRIFYSLFQCMSNGSWDTFLVALQSYYSISLLLPWQKVHSLFACTQVLFVLFFFVNFFTDTFEFTTHTLTANAINIFKHHHQNTKLYSCFPFKFINPF